MTVWISSSFEISDTQDSVLPPCQTPASSSKYSVVRCISNSLLGVWKCGQTHSFVFDMVRRHRLLRLILHPLSVTAYRYTYKGVTHNHL